MTEEIPDKLRYALIKQIATWRKRAEGSIPTDRAIGFSTAADELEVLLREQAWLEYWSRPRR
jgi:hypothetical protein